MSQNRSGISVTNCTEKRRNRARIDTASGLIINKSVKSSPLRMYP